MLHEGLKSSLEQDGSGAAGGRKKLGGKGEAGGWGRNRGPSWAGAAAFAVSWVPKSSPAHHLPTDVPTVSFSCQNIRN